METCSGSNPGVSLKAGQTGERPTTEEDPRREVMPAPEKFIGYFLAIN